MLYKSTNAFNSDSPYVLTLLLVILLCSTLPVDCHCMSARCRILILWLFCILLSYFSLMWSFLFGLPSFVYWCSRYHFIVMLDFLLAARFLLFLVSPIFLTSFFLLGLFFFCLCFCSLWLFFCLRLPNLLNGVMAFSLELQFFLHGFSFSDFRSLYAPFFLLMLAIQTHGYNGNPFRIVFFFFFLGTSLETGKKWISMSLILLM